MSGELVSIRNCRIRDEARTCVSRIDWEMEGGEAWLVIGANGSGKADFVQALAGMKSFEKNQDGEASSYRTCFPKESVALVSLEVAARLIAEERERDESEILNREDEGRTARAYISEVLGGSSQKNAPLPQIAYRLEAMPQVKLCGVEKILDRGLRYLSTGEIRRTLLCRALLSGAKLLVLSDPFAGLDSSSRTILLDFFNTIAKRQLFAKDGSMDFPRIILSMERFHEIPDAVNRVLEFSKGKISFCGERDDYEALLKKRNEAEREKRDSEREEFILALKKIREESLSLTEDIRLESGMENLTSLIRFEDVNVGWGENRVLRNMSWEVKPGEHWLLRGPNGSGKTTMLELITGDNMQVFREKVYLFGKRRGSGETIWDIKRQLGIVSYRLHVEYRMVGGTSLEDVIISGFKDSIGLYEAASDFERATARQWLKLAGFSGREKESFSSLSYGEQRAILILRAAVKSPRVLILDEPCHGLDESYREKILRLLEQIALTGTTTLLHVTHDPTEALESERHIMELCPEEEPMYRIL